MNEASQSLLAVLGKVLDLSKVGAGELIVERVKFRLSTLLKDLTDVMAVQADARAIGLELVMEGGLPDALEGDSSKLRQILTHLLSNAIKFTQRGDVTLRVRRSATTENGATLAFAVQDTGVGFAAEARAQMFAPLVQADPSITQPFGGAGLGLSIVKRLADLMGGHITLQSTPGIGSTFEILLDFSLAPPAPPAEAPEVPEANVLAGLHVLIVDDSDIDLEIARRILELEGAKVWLADDGQEAFEILHADPHSIDVVLVDARSALGGHEATRRIRQDLKLEDLPIIALAASALSSERKRAAEAGMNDYIVRPFDAKTLVRSVLRQLRPPDRRAARLGEVASRRADLPKSWPHLDGIDGRAAHARLGGDVALFHSTIQRLLREFPDNLFDEVDASRVDLASLAGQMHKLRGCATMLGATAIQHVAGSIEAACVAGEGERAIHLRRRLSSELRLLRRSSTGEFATAKTAPESVSQDGGQLDLQAIADS